MLKFFRKVLCMILAVVMIAGITPRVEAQAATTPAKVTEEQVKQRMETVMKFVGKYFTTYGSNGEKPCQNYYTSGHGCSDCGTSKLINSSWIKNTFGLTASSVSNLPSFRFAPNGSMAQPCSSCVAFATMVHWFLYAQNSTDKVTVSQIVQKGTFNSETFSKAKVGDIITMVSGSDHYHTMIFVSLKSNGVEVIDCNWNGANVGSTKVQKRVHYFSNSNGCTVTINRATNYSAHVHDYSGDKNIGYCNSCNNDYLTTSAFNSSKVYTSGTVTPKTTTQLHVKMRPYAASSWTNGDLNIKADSATMEYTCKNHWGNTWYCVKFKDSSGNYKTGYVYNEDVNFVKNPNTVSASCFLASKFGGKINEGDSLWISKSEYGGSIKSTDGTTKLSKVVFGIYNTNGSLTSSKNEVTKTNINATSYSITSSDDTILFSSLSQGSYVFKITGYDVDGKSGSASFNFTVVKSGTTTYTVSYNANGGSGEPSSQTKIKDTTLTLSTQKPTRDGYTFLGWATSSSATSAQYQPGGSYTNNASVTLYAVWRAQTYTISYDANGGSGAPSNQTKTYGVNLILSSTVPYKSGYEFKGWQAPSIQGTNGWVTTKPSSGSYEIGYKYYIYGYECDHCRDYGYDYDVDYTFYMGNDKNEVISTVKDNPSVYGSYTPSKLRRFWLIETSYKGADYYPGQVGSTYNYFTADFVAEDGKTGRASIYKTHFYFESNVYRQSSSTGKIYQPGATYTVDESVKLTAIWKEAAKYTISYNANGGSGAPVAQTKTYDVALKLSTQQPTRDGYTFIGWATSSSATSAQYQPGGSYTSNANVTLYAVWQKNAPVTYTVSYNANGGSGAPAAQTKTHDVALKLSTQQPTRDGYTFIGWATSSSATSAQYQPGGSYTSNANVTLYAVWQMKDTNAPTITVATVNGSAGKEVTVGISIENNPGIAGMTFALDYDKTRIELVGYEDSGMKGWTIGVENAGASWAEIADYTDNGEILKLKFRVLDNAADGMAHIRIIELETFNSDEKEVKTVAASGGVNVINRFPGDINDDGKVDIRDAIRLAKYLAKENVEINLSNANVNGDDKVDVRDLIRLKKYLAKMPVTLV